LEIGKTLPRSFYARDPVTVSRELLGMVLMRRIGRKWLAGRIVETEAYLGSDDPAAHSFAGLTERTRVLFGPAGHAYVYVIYGSYHCLNFSCEQQGTAGCTLIRALEPLVGVEEMREMRGLDGDLSDKATRQIANGPSKLCLALDITRDTDNGKDVCDPKSDIQVQSDGFLFPQSEIGVTPRIGITKAADLPLRFVLKNSRYLSRPYKG
jgi:DNA-3-methyladenine glycosylase